MEGTHTKESILLFIEGMLRDNILQTEDLRLKLAGESFE